MGKTEAARTFGVALSSVKRYVGVAREGRPLTPKKRPGLRPKIDEQGKRLLQADLAKRQGGGRAVRINRESLEAYMSGGTASGEACGLTETRSSASRKANHKAVMIETIEALEA
jgi:hypothetical protein